MKFSKYIKIENLLCFTILLYWSPFKYFLGFLSKCYIIAVIIPELRSRNDFGQRFAFHGGSPERRDFCVVMEFWWPVFPWVFTYYVTSKWRPALLGLTRHFPVGKSSNSQKAFLKSFLWCVWKYSTWYLNIKSWGEHVLAFLWFTVGKKRREKTHSFSLAVLG